MRYKFWNCCKVEDLEDALVIWIGQMNTKKRTVATKVIKKQAKVLGEQISVDKFYTQKNSVYFA